MAEPTGDFTAELRDALCEMTEAGEDYWSESLESDAVEHVTTKVLDRRRWVILQLDVYRRRSDGALAGVRWDAPATEYQQGQQRNPVVVVVDRVMRLDYRVRKAGARPVDDGDPAYSPLGEAAYAGYFMACGGRSLVSGDELPSWDEQDPTARAAWTAAAEAVAARVRG